MSDNPNFNLVVTGDSGCSSLSDDQIMQANTLLHLEDASQKWYAPCKDAQHALKLVDLSTTKVLASARFKGNYHTGTLSEVSFGLNENRRDYNVVDNPYMGGSFKYSNKKYRVNFSVYPNPGTSKYHQFNFVVSNDMSNWMADLFNKKPALLNKEIYNVVFPTSHDALAYSFDKNAYEIDVLGAYANIISKVSKWVLGDRVPHFISGLSTTQYPISNQLNNGIRGFDIRFANKFASGLNGGDFYATGSEFYHPHGLKGQNVGKAIKNYIIPFLNAHRQEFILLDFTKANNKNIDVRSDLQNILDDLYEHYQPLLMRGIDLNKNIRTLINENKRLIVIGDRSAFSGVDNKEMFTYLYRYGDGLGGSNIDQGDKFQKIDSYNEASRGAVSGVKAQMQNAINYIPNVSHFNNSGIINLQNQATLATNKDAVIDYALTSAMNGAFTGLLLKSQMALNFYFYSLSNGLYKEKALEIFNNKPKHYIITIMDDFAGVELSTIARYITEQQTDSTAN